MSAAAPRSKRSSAQPRRRKQRPPEYPRCAELFIPVARHPAGGFAYTPRRMLIHALEARGETFSTAFSRLFGHQTQCDLGPYAWDVEAVLERMVTSRRTGSQLLWD